MRPGHAGHRILRLAPFGAAQDEGWMQTCSTPRPEPARRAESKDTRPRSACWSRHPAPPARVVGDLRADLAVLVEDVGALRQGDEILVLRFRQRARIDARGA